MGQRLFFESAATPAFSRLSEQLLTYFLNLPSGPTVQQRVRSRAGGGLVARLQDAIVVGDVTRVPGRPAAARTTPIEARIGVVEARTVIAVGAAPAA